MAEYQSRTNKSKKAKSTTSSDDRPSLVKSRMRIYFPSLSTVENSRGGKGVGRLQPPLTLSCDITKYYDVVLWG